MKRNLLTLALVGILFSCASEDTSEKNTASPAEEVEQTDGGAAPESEELSVDLINSIVNKGGAKAEAQIEIEAMMADMEEAKTASSTYAPILGHWVGQFGKNMINLTLAKVSDGTIEGFSVCAGNFRKIEGTIASDKSGVYQVKMDEPGSDPYDGSFEFVINNNSGELSGKWTPFKEKGNSAKNYTLAKKEFSYNPNAGKYPQASTGLLSYEDVQEMDEWTLGYMRNEIYARHGYSFKNKDWRYEFEGEDWYMPIGVDIRDEITDIEIQNIGLIYEYESYYEDYYDEYGR